VTLANGGDLGQALISAGITVASAVAFNAVGGLLGHATPTFLSPQHITKIAAHGAVGGAISRLRGGEFKSGFLAGAFAQFAAPGLASLDQYAPTPVGVAAAAVAGGVGAELGGGKFVNGAVTGAFSRLHNDLSNVPCGENAAESCDFMMGTGKVEDIQAAEEEATNLLMLLVDIATLPVAVIGKGIFSGVRSLFTKGGLGKNPFKGKTPEQIDKMFKNKGFEPRGPDPLNGKGGYVNPKTGRSYHIDLGGKYKKGTEYPHVDVNRTNGYKLPKKKYPLGDRLNDN